MGLGQQKKGGSPPKNPGETRRKEPSWLTLTPTPAPPRAAVHAAHFSSPETARSNAALVAARPPRRLPSRRPPPPTGGETSTTGFARRARPPPERRLGKRPRRPPKRLLKKQPKKKRGIESFLNLSLETPLIL